MGDDRPGHAAGTPVTLCANWLQFHPRRSGTEAAKRLLILLEVAMSAVGPFAHEESEAYRSAFALHLRLCQIPRVRGGGRYQQKLESASFRILMLLCEVAARGRDARASDLCASAHELCLKISTTLALMRASGFVDGTDFDSLLRQTHEAQSVLASHLAGRGEPGIDELIVAAPPTRAATPTRSPRVDDQPLEHRNQRESAATPAGARNGRATTVSPGTGTEHSRQRKLS